jgi:heterodisulfide reductase subunit A-like polyferredoxin
MAVDQAPPLTAKAYSHGIDYARPMRASVNGNGVSGILNGAKKTDSHDIEIDYARPTKVIVIGAGISGILAAIRFPRHISNLDLVVYDKNQEIGGTWYENRYPGIACGMYPLSFSM